MQVFKRSCPICEAACGLRIVADVNKREVIRIEGDPDDFRSQGFVCPKSQAMKGLFEDPQRLRRPVKKTSSGDWQEISWDEAFAEVCRNLLTLRERHGFEALGVGWVVAGVDLELVHLLEVEGDAAIAAVDFEGVAIAPTGGEARGFERTDRAVFEFDVHERGVLDGDFAHFFRAGHGVGECGCALVRNRALFDEAGHRARDVHNVTDEVVGEVDGVGVEVGVWIGMGEYN